jgi:tetratricopeptide (TPR) repeat protein
VEQGGQQRAPLSPSFCQRAEAFLAQGKAEQAHALCREGVARYPDYATGHLVLGKTYEALGRSLDALMEYEAVLRMVPDSQIARSRVEEIGRRDAEAFARYVKKQQRVLGDTKGGPSLQEYLADRPATLFTRSRLPGPRPQRFVTQTLAEIYASQGEYDEAIEAYRRLSEQRPANAARYGERIKELEALQRAARDGGTPGTDQEDNE